MKKHHRCPGVGLLAPRKGTKGTNRRAIVRTVTGQTRAGSVWRAPLAAHGGWQMKTLVSGLRLTDLLVQQFRR